MGWKQEAEKVPLLCTLWASQRVMSHETAADIIIQTRHSPLSSLRGLFSFSFTLGDQDNQAKGCQFVFRIFSFSYFFFRFIGCVMWDWIVRLGMDWGVRQWCLGPSFLLLSFNTNKENNSSMGYGVGFFSILWLVLVVCSIRVLIWFLQITLMAVYLKESVHGVLIFGNLCGKMSCPHLVFLSFHNAI